MGLISDQGTGYDDGRPARRGRGRRHGDGGGRNGGYEAGQHAGGYDVGPEYGYGHQLPSLPGCEIRQLRHLDVSPEPATAGA